MKIVPIAIMAAFALAVPAFGQVANNPPATSTGPVQGGGDQALQHAAQAQQETGSRDNSTPATANAGTVAPNPQGNYAGSQQQAGTSKTAPSDNH